MKLLSKKIYLNFGLSILSLLFCLGVFEVALRIFDPTPVPYIMVVPDQFYGWKGRPNFKYWVIAEEGSFFARTNSHGLSENKEYSYEKNKGVFRILVLGDSFAQASTTPMEESFHSRVEDLLNQESSDLSYEVINTGVSGYATDNQYLLFKYEGYKYNPDLVILAFLTANDIRDNHHRLHFQHFGKMWKPYFVIEDDILKLRNFPCRRAYLEKKCLSLERIKAFLRTRFKLYHFIGDRITNHHPALTRVLMSWGIIRKHEIRSDRTIIPLGFNIYAPEYQQIWKDAWEITKRLILKLNEEVKRHGAKLVLVLLTDPDQVHADFWKYRLSVYPEMQNMQWDLSKPERIMVDFCNKNNITMLNLLPSFKEYVRETGEYLHFPKEKAHWNSQGHKFASELIFKFLVENNLVPFKEEGI